MSDEDKSPQKPNDKSANSASNTDMHVRVYAPYKIYYNGPAQSVSAVNNTGPFDILPRHHNFMTLLAPCDILVRHGDEQEKITIQRGVMHVKANEVIVFLDV